jgi:hypothetical protein
MEKEVRSQKSKGRSKFEGRRLEVGKVDRLESQKAQKSRNCRLCPKRSEAVLGAGASEPVASEPRERSEARLGVFVVEARRTRERVGGLGAKPPDQKKRGRWSPPSFIVGLGGLTLLAALFLAALGCFLRHVSCPSLHRGLSCAGPHCAASPVPAGTLSVRAQRPRFVAEPATCALRHLIVDCPDIKKGAAQNAAPGNSSRPETRSRESGPAGPVLNGVVFEPPNTWAEPVRFTQDVDYG